jgi:hypothetical protein
MITKFKIFESKSKIPQVGDYVKFNWQYFSYDFFKTAIGQIIDIDNRIGEIDMESAYCPFTVRFEENNPINKSKVNKFSGFEFSNWDSDKDVLLMKDDIKKYNL